MPTSIKYFTFEVTRRCNGRCIYCNIWKDTEHENELTVDDLTARLLPYRQHFREVVSIAITGGEPFLRDDLPVICARLKFLSPKARFGLVTNGLCPDKVVETMKKIREIDAACGIGVSIDGFYPEDQQLRGSNVHYELAWTTVRRLLENRFNVSVGSTLTRINIGRALEFKSFCEERVNVKWMFQIVGESVHYYDNLKRIDGISLTSKDLEMLEKVCQATAEQVFPHYLVKYMKEKKQIIPCFSGFTGFFLNSRGTVYPCIHLNSPLGNIKEEQFGDVWMGEKARAIRKDIVRKACHCFTPCEVCSWGEANFLPLLKIRLKKRLGG